MTQDFSAILLPVARVDFFVLDDGTAAVAARLSADWRFARVAVDVQRGDIDTAVARYAEAASPELIIVETNDISDTFIQKLGALAGVCAEGTDAVVIGPTNDVHLYRSLVGMGVRDYLVRPVGDTDMVEIIAKALVEKRGLAGSRMTTVIGSKGGAGATSVAQMIAWLCAEKLQQKTTLIDAAGSAGSLGVALGLEPAAAFSECVRIGQSGSEDDLRRILQPCGANLTALVAGGEPIFTTSPDADAVEALVNRVMQKSPVVVMDLSGAAPDVQKRMIARSGRVVLVTLPTLTGLRNCRTLLGEIKTLRGSTKEVDLVVNMQGMSGSDEVPLADIKRVLDIEPAAAIAFLPKVFLGSEATGKPAAQNRQAQEILKDLTPLAVRTTGVSEKAAATDEGDSGPFGFLKKLGKGK